MENQETAPQADESGASDPDLGKSNWEIVERTLLGNDITDNDELKLPKNDRSPLTSDH